MIYICIPSHNEERTVGILLWKIRQVLTAFPRDYELLVLDDASTDRTTEVLAPYARILPLTVLRHGERLGYAASLDELLREAVRRSEYPRRDVILTLQADFTEDPDDIPALLKRIESGADIVTTRATIAREHAPTKLRWLRALTGRLLRRLGWPEAVTDVLSGMRAYRVIGIKKALDERGTARLLEWADAWAANAALLRAVKGYVRRVDEVTVMLRPDRRQRDSRLDAWANARALVRMALRRPPLPATPARRTPASIVSARELTAATRPVPAAPAPEPARRGRRGSRERPAPETGPRKRGKAAAAESGERAQKTERGERGDRGDRAGRTPAAEKGGRAGRGERKERAEATAAEQGRRARTDHQPEPGQPDQEQAAATPGRSGRRGRRRGGGGGGGETAAVGGEAPAVSAAGELERADAMVPDGSLAEVLDAGLIESLEALTASTESGQAGAASGRKSRRRRSARRGRKRSATEVAAAEGAPDGAADEVREPLAPGNAESASAASAVGGSDVAGESGAQPGPVEEGGEGTTEGSPRRRRSRRGGRGRSRGRRGTAGVTPTEGNAGGDTGERGSSYGETAAAPAPEAAASPATEPPAAPSEPTATPPERHNDPAEDAYRPPARWELPVTPPAPPALPAHIDEAAAREALPRPERPQGGPDETTATD